MKIGIMGGTFDPIHNGHLMLGEYAYRSCSLDEIWFMPNGNPPHKEHSAIETNAKQRAEMVGLSIADKNYFKLNLYEVNRGQVSYSYETMEYLHETYRDSEFYFIIGADSLFAIESWVKPERIFPTCTILAAYRDDVDTREEMEGQIQHLKDRYQAKIKLLETPLLDVSSRELRSMLRTGQSIAAYVPEAVMCYIKRNGLYSAG